MDLKCFQRPRELKKWSFKLDTQDFEELQSEALLGPKRLTNWLSSLG